MKLLRVGTKGNEKPAILDKNGKIRDLSSQIQDMSSEALNFETISKINKIDLKKLPVLLKKSTVFSLIHRIYPCHNRVHADTIILPRS